MQVDQRIAEIICHHCWMHLIVIVNMKPKSTIVLQKFVARAVINRAPMIPQKSSIPIALPTVMVHEWMYLMVVANPTRRKSIIRKVVIKRALWCVKEMVFPSPTRELSQP
jgi:hypothetical protein